MQWCPVIGAWFQDIGVSAAHIFPHRLGQTIMTSIFGSDTENPELMEIQNGLILSKEAENFIDNSKVVIVPDVDDDGSEEAVDKWTRSEPKGYEIRIVDLSPADLDTYLPGQSDGLSGSQRKWRQLDNAPLQLRADHRLRARYLYWRHCQTTLRYSCRNAKHERNNALPEFRKPVWGTRGAYMNKAMLRASVEEMDHGYVGLLKGATGEADDAVEPDTTVLMAANEAIAWTFQVEVEDDDDYSDA